MTRGLPAFIRDNLEAFAVAIALALVVRHYSLEAFRIPSRSMMPTLYGSETAGDRILVDKFRWLRHEPERWEPAVFQYPLNRAKNFIKRMVGMPGERLRIDDGDIWTSRGGGTWTIERKPEGPQEALFFPFYPAPAEDRNHFRSRRCWEGLGWEIDERAGRFAVDAKGKVPLRFNADVVQYQDGWVSDTRLGEHEYKEGTLVAGDLRVRFELRVERPGLLVVELTEHGLARRLVLSPDGSRATVARADGTEQTFPVDLRLARGEYEISFANVDDALVVSVEGDAEASATFPFSSVGDADWRREQEDRVDRMSREADSLEDDQPEEASRLRIEVEALKRKLADGRYRVTFEAEGIAATLAGVRIDRDVHYTEDGEWDIPEGHYFMLGDNTRQSKDSRKWWIAEVVLNDGTVIRWEEAHELQTGDLPGQPNADFDPKGPDRVIEVKADVDGLVRRFHTRDVASVRERIHWGFVSKDHLVGRAFAIFWPIHVWPVLKNPTRIGLIR